MRVLITGGNGNIAKIIKNNLNNDYTYITPGRAELNLLDFEMVKKFFESSNNIFDICFHTSIQGGRRTKGEDYDVVYNNLLMFENLMFFSNKFKMIFNMDSGAIYDRETDILNKKEDELNTIPKDFYGFSKYLIYKRSLSHSNLFNFRIFNIFHPNEEKDRFVKAAFFSSIKKITMTIHEDKYFEFVYYKDFIKIIQYYIDEINNGNIPPKVLNISYTQKYKLSDIAKLIDKDINLDILVKESSHNYSGSSEKIDSLKMNLDGLEASLKDYYNEVKYE